MIFDHIIMIMIMIEEEEEQQQKEEDIVQKGRQKQYNKSIGTYRCRTCFVVAPLSTSTMYYVYLAGYVRTGVSISID